MLCIYGWKRAVQAGFRLVSLNSPLTDGVHGSLRHGRLYFLARPSVLAQSRLRTGGRHFTVQGRLGPVLVFGETCSGNCVGTGFLPRANQTAGPLAGGWMACPDEGLGCPVLSLRPGNGGESARSGPRCPVSALTGRRSQGPPTVRTHCLRVEAWIPLLPGHAALSFVSLMPWTRSLPDAPRHSASLGKRRGQSGLWSPFSRRNGAFAPARGAWAGRRSSQKLQNPQTTCV